MRVAVFDLDGTLADTAADLIAAANGALAELGVAARLDARAHRATAFAGGRAMLRAGLAAEGIEMPEEQVERGFPRLLVHYEAAIAARTRLYPGVEAALDALAARGWTLAICTNKPVALAELLLVKLGVRDRFAAVLGADSLSVRKPDPLHLTETVLRAGGAPERAVLIGDTVTDREAARAAEVPCVLVAFGPEGPGIARLAPAAMIADYAELPDLLERLIPEDTKVAVPKG
ncbi:HAD-IA family hydrolase [Amaricoccus solimangrovi]|uniref:Phosphoglycolate phosphatase n=1 Tax=Amaricoccus solimangrovi TaxID=2589815 RepID=A0A501WKC2_9RHOB|nr:HAD-IA family hydrolase [Amaricoccus solimangrovi]TPE48554.1 HAD-IA family hydrolase [Amaricoccus solimangrovi]